MKLAAEATAAHSATSRTVLPCLPSSGSVACWRPGAGAGRGRLPSASVLAVGAGFRHYSVGGHGPSSRAELDRSLLHGAPLTLIRS